MVDAPVTQCLDNYDPHVVDSEPFPVIPAAI